MTKGNDGSVTVCGCHEKVNKWIESKVSLTSFWAMITIMSTVSAVLFVILVEGQRTVSAKITEFDKTLTEQCIKFKLSHDKLDGLCINFNDRTNEVNQRLINLEKEKHYGKN